MFLGNRWLLREMKICPHDQTDIDSRICKTCENYFMALKENTPGCGYPVFMEKENPDWRKKERNLMILRGNANMKRAYDTEEIMTFCPMTEEKVESKLCSICSYLIDEKCGFPDEEQFMEKSIQKHNAEMRKAHNELEHLDELAESIITNKKEEKMQRIEKEVNKLLFEIILEDLREMEKNISSTVKKLENDAPAELIGLQISTNLLKQTTKKSYEMRRFLNRIKHQCLDIKED